MVWPTVKTLHITPTFFPSVGGIETVLRDLTSHLRRNGIVADVLHISPSNKSRCQQSVDGGTVWRVPLFPNRLIGVTPPIRSLLLDYDLLHVHDPQGMALSANVLIQGRGKKKLLSTHGGYFHTSSYSLAKKIHWQWFAPMILRQYDEILASSAADCDRFKTKAPNVGLLANGIDVSKFKSIDHSSALPATRWIYWGRLSQNKRIDLLVDTVKRARDAGLDVRLTIAGTDFDGLLASIQARIASYGLSDYIRVAGPLSDATLLAELADHTVFITASEYEGFGLTVVEAMAAGLIVICRNVPPLNGFVTARKNGALINFDGSASDLASISVLGAASIPEIAAMRKAARAAALPYSWDRVVKQYIEVYDGLMRR
jgi:alpha-1,3-mannosyltransferase